MSISSTTEPFYDDYPIYEYVPKFNMYAARTATKVCANFISGICVAPCYSLVQNIATFPGGGCMSKQCKPPEVLVP